MANFYAIAKFSPSDITKVRGVTDPMVVYTDWPTVELAAVAAQQANTDGSTFAIFEAVAVTAFATPQVVVNLIGATVPTTV